MNKVNILPLQESDLDEIVDAFKKIGWEKPRGIYENYLAEQAKETRTVLVAKDNEKFCGYVTIKWESSYSEFDKKNIPEISDLNVLPRYRNQGIGSVLIATCEKIVRDRGHTDIGIGVGMTKDYGNAQRLYVKLGFIPDGEGLFYKTDQVQYGSNVTVDDDLVLWFIKQL